MSNYKPDFYIRLGLDSSATEKDVKRAYAKRLKSIDQATQADEFLQLRQDYELALDYVKKFLDSKNSADDNLFNDQVKTNENSAHSQSNAESESESDKETNRDKNYIKNDPNFESVNNLNSNINSESKNSQALDFQNEFDYINTDSNKINFENEKIGIHYADLILVIYSFFDEFVELMNSKSLSLEDIKHHLVQFLQSESFFNIEARLYFEKILVEQIASARFSDSNLNVLLAAEAYFNWKETFNFPENSASIEYVKNLLLHLYAADENFMRSVNFLLKKPTSIESTQALALYEKIQSTNQQFLQYCVSDKKLALWKDAFQDRSYLQSFFDFAEPKLKKGKIFRKVFLIILVLTCIKLLLGNMSGKKSEEELIKFSNTCDQAFTQAIEKDWKGFSLSQIEVLKECTLIKQPVGCEARKQLLDNISIATQFNINANFSDYPTFSKEFLINSNGLQYEFAENASCSSMTSFINSKIWGVSSDTNAFAKLVPRYLECEKNEYLSALNKDTAQSFLKNRVDEIQLQNLFVYSFLSQSVFAGKEGSNNKLPQLTASQVLPFAQPYEQLSIAKTKEIHDFEVRTYGWTDPLHRSYKLLDAHLKSPLDNSACVNPNDKTLLQIQLPQKESK